jgi:hypothetical protein
MAKLIKSKDSFLYALDNLLEDVDWGFLYSYAIESLNNEDTEVNQSFPLMQKQRAELLSKLAERKLDPIDRFQK